MTTTTTTNNQQQQQCNNSKERETLETELRQLQAELQANELKVGIDHPM